MSRPNAQNRAFVMPESWTVRQLYDIIEMDGKKETVSEESLDLRIAEQRLIAKQNEFGKSIIFKLRKHKEVL